MLYTPPHTSGIKVWDDLLPKFQSQTFKRDNPSQECTQESIRMYNWEQVNRHAFDFMPGNLAPPTICQLSHQFHACFLKPPRKMLTAKHTNVQLPMSILLHRSNSIMQQAHRQGKHKREGRMLQRTVVMHLLPSEIYVEQPKSVHDST